MCLAQFFGNKSLFDIIVAVVALSTGVYTFYKSFWERAKLALYPGDRLGLVVSTRGGSRKFHLRANLVNHAVKAGTLHRLEAEITDPKGTTHRYQWKLFFEYLSGAQAVQPKSDPYPISVAGKTSQLLLAELEMVSTQSSPAWPPGRYRMEVIGWVNRANRKESPNLKAIFHFGLSTVQSQQIVASSPTQESLVEVSIDEWSVKPTTTPDSAG
jgi:hypothetical protein